MNSATQWITLAAIILTSAYSAMIITQLLKRPSWPSWLKEALSIIVSILVGLAAAWQSGALTTIVSSWKTLSPAEIIAFGVAVYTVAKAFYAVHFSGVAWMQWLGAK
jgi:predicted membrane channel-forming protein YqfA (hemolysin III family)